MEKEKNFICPNCKKKQTSYIMWSSASIAQKMNLKTNTYEDLDDKVIGEMENCICPNCKEEIPFKLLENFF